jgi:two-component system phosphate regulon sensor histidine kinase PhoR
MTARVLVVDDEYGVRSGVRQLLELEGYEVFEAETGRGALAQLEERTFDIALVDYRLPDLDGLTLLASLRDRAPHTTTCMITAYANLDTAIAATRQGVDFFLPKPFTPDDLLGVVASLARHHALREEAERLRREREASQTRALVASLRDAVLVINRAGEVVLANHALGRWLGCCADSLLGLRVEELRGFGALAALGELLTDAAPEARVRELEIQERCFLVSSAPFESGAGEVLGRILTIADTTSVRHLAIERSRFVRTVVHEFRSPLGAIKSVLEVALDQSLGPDLASYRPLLGRASARVDGLSELIGELLSFSRIDLERAPALPPGGVAVAGVLAEVLDAHRERIAARALVPQVELAPELPRVALCENDLRTILSNLVGNAIKYGRDGGELGVVAGVEGAFVVLAVRDDGIGIGADHVGRIFEEFFRERRPETRDIEGNGLGLAIVRRLAERAGGSVEVASVEHRGSTFSVRVPIASASAAGASPAP